MCEQAEECALVVVSGQVVAGEALESTIDSAKETQLSGGKMYRSNRVGFRLARPGAL